MQKLKTVLKWVFGLLTAFFLFSAGKTSKAEKKLRKAIKESEETVSEVKKGKKQREKEAAVLKEKLKKITTGTLILVFLFCVPVRAAYTEEEYREVVEIAVRYQQLYEEAEADNDRLIAEIEALAKAAEDVIKYRQAFDLGVGAFIYDWQPGFYLGISYKF